jgi:hypothetical protein
VPGINTHFSGGNPQGNVNTSQGQMTVPQWIEAHFTWVGATAPAGTNSLTTTWTCGGAQESEGPTIKNEGESHEAFMRRHKLAAEAKMAECPPE